MFYKKRTQIYDTQDITLHSLYTKHAFKTKYFLWTVCKILHESLTIICEDFNINLLPGTKKKSFMKNEVI